MIKEVRNRSTGQLLTIDQFKALHSNVSFPEEISNDIVYELGYDVILMGEPAVVTPPYGINTLAGIEEINGEWFTRFVEGPIFEDTKDEDGNITTAEEHEKEYRKNIDDNAAARIRSKRNKELSNTDWTQLADSSANQNDWIQYRQELRDITNQEGFPHAVTWPTAPSDTEQPSE